MYDLKCKYFKYKISTLNIAIIMCLLNNFQYYLSECVPTFNVPFLLGLDFNVSPGFTKSNATIANIFL